VSSGRVYGIDWVLKNGTVYLHKQPDNNPDIPLKNQATGNEFSMA
jgi:hypothetical protein